MVTSQFQADTEVTNAVHTWWKWPKAIQIFPNDHKFRVYDKIS